MNYSSEILKRQTLGGKTGEEVMKLSSTVGPAITRVSKRIGCKMIYDWVKAFSITLNSSHACWLT